MKNLKGKTLYNFKLYILRRLQSKILKRFYNSFGKNSIIESPLIIRNKKRISIGDNTTIRKNARIELVTKYNDKSYTPNLIIGDNVTIEFNFHITCSGNITIENDVLIAGYVTIIDNNHGYEDITKSVQKNDLTNPIDIVIGKDSFIGMGARILPGVIVGQHCVIGTNSVVTKSVPDYCVLVGNPARIIKKYNLNTQKWENEIKIV